MQGAIAQQINYARHTVRHAVYGEDRAGRKAGASTRAASNPKPMVDVLRGFVLRQALESATHRDTLIELTHLWQLQLRFQLELSDEDDLQQLLSADRF